jgi:hypothetical protein
MHLLDNPTLGCLPKRFPIGSTYVVEGRGGEEGDLRVFSRYVVLPGGQRINVGADSGGPASPSARRRSRNRTENPAQNGEKRLSASSKKIMAGCGTPGQQRR